MSTNLNQNIKKSIPLPDGSRIVLIDMMGRATSEAWEDANRNVYRIDHHGNVLWQIGTASARDERFPYTNIYLDDNGNLKAYCWDGGEYTVDVKSGGIDGGKLTK